MPQPEFDLARASMVTVGGGRGFIVATSDEPIVLTAAHCLPHLPTAMSFSDTDERTYTGLLGRLGDEQQPIAAECLFVDPVADIAVFGAPDGQEMLEAYEVYRAFLSEHQAMPISDAPADGVAWVMSLAGDWVRCSTWHNGRGGGLCITGADAPLVAGMSGSPMITRGGSAVGVYVTTYEEQGTTGGPQPLLLVSLPGGLLRLINGAGDE